jgi:CRISPR/Cas system-associated exonuclease Cas4 (RecB family)
MALDKYSAVWVSHTSISDYLKCPRSYYLKNIYKDPATGHKIKLMSPPLALGQAVHEVIEALSLLPVKVRFKDSLTDKYNLAWQKISGKKGGFFSPPLEAKYKERGLAMIKRVIENPGPLLNLSVKIQMDLPNYWLSEADNIILCGKVDWLEYIPESDSVHIIDFKTSKSAEAADSLQLPIYHLLVHNCQKRHASKASYWYLEMSDDLTPKILPDLETAHTQVYQLAKKIKLSRQLSKFDCPSPGACMHCQPYEEINNKNAEFVFANEYRQDVYIQKQKLEVEETPEGLLL